MRIGFVHPRTGVPLVRHQAERLTDANGVTSVEIVDGIPRFVPRENYAASFGEQWNLWRDTLSDAGTLGGRKLEMLLARTGWDPSAQTDRTLLECGMGGGDDTEALLSLPFAEIHAFDLSHAVDRAVRLLDDDRLTISQASIYEIPYPDESFDVVFCHRVIQHTPDPERALRCIAQKVRPGGELFLHSYLRSWRYLMNYKYKYRWLTKRLPRAWVLRFLERFGPGLFALHERAARHRWSTLLAYNFVPFERLLPAEARSDPAVGSHRDLPREQLLELATLCTFDALTPVHDHPMTPSQVKRILESEGLRVTRMHAPPAGPLCVNAVRHTSRCGR